MVSAGQSPRDDTRGVVEMSAEGRYDTKMHDHSF